MALGTALPHKFLTIKITLACAFFTTMTLAKTYPLIRHFSTQLPGGLGDPLLVTWILAWGSHALTTDPLNLFNANIFYPVQNTLALSEHMIAVVPLFAPVYLLTGNPIAAYNTVFFLSFILCGMAMFLLVHHWTENFWASLLSGCLFAFAPIRFAELSHLQLYNFYWAPLVLLFLDKFLRSKCWRDLGCFAVCYWLAVLSSVYLGWFTTITVGVYMLYYMVHIDKGLLSRMMVLRYAVFIVASLIILIPFHLPYYAIQQQWGFSTSLQECTYWAADPLLHYLSPPYLFNDAYLSSVESYLPRLRYPPNQQMLFPGLVFGFLVIAGSLPVAKCLPVGRALQLQRLFRVVLVSSLLLSLGPFLVILGRDTGLPLPYLLFYYLVPGFQAMRVPGRFALMAMLGASVLAALGFLRASQFLRRRWSHREVWTHRFQGLLVLLWIGLFLFELGFKPLPLGSIPSGAGIPEVYRWLATRQLDGPIIELPLGQSFWEALTYMYFSTYHWLPIVNGASRFLPPTHAQLHSELSAFPSRKAAELLSAIGVKGLVLHTDQLEPREAARWRNADLADIGLEEVARFDADVVYKLSPVHATHQLHVELAIPDQLPTVEMVQLPRQAMLRLRLLARSGSHLLWVHPSPFGRIPARIEWQEQHTGQRLIQQHHLELPLVIGAEEVWSTSLSMKAPISPGQYRLAVTLPSLELQTAPKPLAITSSRAPQSAESPRLLSAAYVLEAPSSRVITPGGIDVTLLVTNTSGVVWPATAKDDRGEVRLGWRWLKGPAEIPLKEEGREHLQYDVFPGQTYRFQTTIKPPPEPAEYILELGLVSELVTWFSDQGVAPLKLPVRVPSAPGSASP
jgi:hypothetical protein